MQLALIRSITSKIRKATTDESETINSQRFPLTSRYSL